MEIRISTDKDINIFVSTSNEILKNEICLNSSADQFFLKDVFVKNISSISGSLLYFGIF